MLERRIVPQEAMFGMGYLNCGSSGVKTGGWAVVSGVFASVGGPTGKAGKEGYAKVGSICLDALAGRAAAVLSGYQTSYDAQFGMIDKLMFQPEDSDLTLDTIVSGSAVLFITKGYVDTDQYATNFFANTVSVGQRLYVDTNGLLTTGLLGSPANDQLLLKPRAIYWGTKSTNAGIYDSNYSNTGYIFVQILAN